MFEYSKLLHETLPSEWRRYFRSVGIPGTTFYKVLDIIRFNEILIAYYNNDLYAARLAYDKFNRMVNSIYYGNSFYQRVFQATGKSRIYLIEG